MIFNVCNRWIFQYYYHSDVAEGWYTTELAEDHIIREVSLYTEHMSGLVGTLVPYIYGAYFGKIEVSRGRFAKYDVVIMEDCDSPWKYR